MSRKIVRLVLVIGIFFMALSCAATKEKRRAERKTARIHFQAGANFLAKGEYGKALTEFRKAETMQPRDPEIGNALGLAYYYTNRYEESEKAYREALYWKPDYPEVRVNLGSLLARQEKYVEAIAEYRNALNNPFYATPAMALYNIGLCYRGMGDFKEAESAFLEALQHDQNFIQAYFDLGRLQYQENQMEKAIETFNEAIHRHARVEEDPANDLSLASLHYWLALSYFKNGELKRAANHFQEVTKLSSHGALAEEALRYLNLLQ